MAIAKDEAAYLAEWIHHHLFFGFDGIDIYVNNTTDDSWQYAEYLQALDAVNLISGDSFFTEKAHCPQTGIYREATGKARQQGFTHILFLDIDEFWTPADLSSSIKKCIRQCSGDVISFEWFNRHEHTEFSSPVDTRISGARHQFVKSVFALSLDVKTPGIHNVLASGASYRLADGSEFHFSKSQNDFVNREESLKPLKPYFILHRMYRSQREYVSLLGRGRPAFQKENTVKLKNNRLGFNAFRQTAETIEFQENSVVRYTGSFDNFVREFNLSDSIMSGRDFAMRRFEMVLETIRQAGIEDLELIEKILLNVDLPECRIAYSHCLENSIEVIRDNFFVFIRDDQAVLEGNSSVTGQKLKRYLRFFRPRLSFIRKKW